MDRRALGSSLAARQPDLRAGRQRRGQEQPEGAAVGATVLDGRARAGPGDAPRSAGLAGLATWSRRRATPKSVRRPRSLGLAGPAARGSPADGGLCPPAPPMARRPTSWKCPPCPRLHTAGSVALQAGLEARPTPAAPTECPRDPSSPPRARVPEPRAQEAPRGPPAVRRGRHLPAGRPLPADRPRAGHHPGAWEGRGAGRCPGRDRHALGSRPRGLAPSPRAVPGASRARQPLAPLAPAARPGLPRTRPELGAEGRLLRSLPALHEDGRTQARAGLRSALHLARQRAVPPPATEARAPPEPIE